MTPWERVLARRREIEERRQARRGTPAAGAPWKRIALDQRTARAVAALLNAPPPPRPVAALAACREDGWAVLIQHAEGNGEMEVLRTLGDCAPYLRVAVKAPASPRRREREREGPPTGAPEGGPPLPADAQAQVRAVLDDSTRGPASDPGGLPAATSTTREGT